MASKMQTNCLLAFQEEEVAGLTPYQIVTLEQLFSDFLEVRR